MDFQAGVAQLVERQPSKLNVASSNLVARSKALYLAEAQSYFGVRVAQG